MPSPLRSRPDAVRTPAFSPAASRRRLPWLRRIGAGLAAAALSTALLGTVQPALATPAATLRFHKLVAPGFDNPSVISLLQDRQGFVWIGTSAGGSTSDSLTLGEDPSLPTSVGACAR